MSVSDRIVAPAIFPFGSPSVGERSGLGERLERSGQESSLRRFLFEKHPPGTLGRERSVGCDNVVDPR